MIVLKSSLKNGIRLCYAYNTPVNIIFDLSKSSYDRFMIVWFYRIIVFVWSSMHIIKTPYLGQECLVITPSRNIMV